MKKENGEILVDQKLDKYQCELRTVKKKYHKALEAVSRKQEEIDALTALQEHKGIVQIKPSKELGGEGTLFLVASDWHVDETVRAESVNGLNRFNAKIAKKRAELFFKNSLRLLKIFQKDIEIDNIVLALLGDFISGQIHDELKEANSMRPIEAALFAKELIASGIQFLLDNTECRLTIPCSVGNHGRITQKVHHATEYGNSIEYFMYCVLAQEFADNDRVRFIISRGYHNYIKVYGKTFRLNHGHAIRYYGGIGGINVPVKRALAAWDRSMNADYTIIGHFHQMKDDLSFICNGSLIGYNAYGVSIKAEYQRPEQVCFLFDKKRGKTIVAPVILEAV